MDPAPLASIARVAVPATYVVAVALIVGEQLALRAMGLRPRARQSLASLASGAMSFGLLAVATRLLFAGLMERAWTHRATDLGAGPLTWLAAFVTYDLMFWVAHVAGHRVRLLWCFHSVHHTSTEMRLTSAVRGSSVPFDIGTMVMQLSTGQTLTQRLQATHSSSFTVKVRSADMAMAWWLVSSHAA